MKRLIQRGVPGAAAFAVAGIAAILSATGCRTESVVHTTPPAADFLLVAGDSTFWITTGPLGTRVRGSPILLSRVNARFYELYVADEDHSYYNALFTTQRIYRRDLLTGDSDAVFRDTVVTLAARRYAASHPRESPLRPDEEVSDDPTTSVTGEVDIVDVDGPYLSYEYRGSHGSRPASRAHPADSVTPEREIVRRGVVDLRSRKRVGLAALVGSRVADSIFDVARRTLTETVDSIAADDTSDVERTARVRAALGQVSFDPLNFSLLDVDRSPAVQFFAHGDAAHGSLVLPMTPVRVPAGNLPAWWLADADALPVGGADSASDIWGHPGIEIIARYDTVGDPDRGQGVELVIGPTTAGTGTVAGKRKEWRIGRFPAPTRVAESIGG